MLSNSWSRQWNAFDKSISKAPKNLLLSIRFPFFKYYRQTLLWISTFTKTTLLLRKSTLKKLRHLLKKISLEDFWRIGQNTYRPMVLFLIFFIIERCYIGQFKALRKFRFFIELWKLVNRIILKISVFSLITLSCISEFWKAPFPYKFNIAFSISTSLTH